VQDDADTAAAAPGVPRPPKLRWALVTAVAGGLFLAAAFPPIGIWPLAVVGPALLAVALRGRSLRGSFCTGLVFGVAFFFLLLSWVLNVAWYAWLGLAGAEAVIFGVLAIGQRLLLSFKAWPVTVAGWWVAAEALRDRWPWGGFPWGRLAMSQAGAPTQGWAAIGGAPVLTFMIALGGTTLAWLIRAAAADRTAGNMYAKRTRVAALGFVAAVAAAVAPAAVTLDPGAASASTGTASAGGKTAQTAEVAAIQGNVPTGRTLAAQLNDTMVTANHAAATEKLAAAVKSGKSPQPDLVIWPENSTDLDPAYWPPIYDELMTATDNIRVPLLAGTVLQIPQRNASQPWAPGNAGQLWVPGKGPTQVYLKRRLVPFGEVIPFRSLLQKITPLTALQPLNFTPGHSVVVFHVKNIQLGDVICYEVGFDDLVRSEVMGGANLLTMQTNDATFERDGQTGETGQQLAMARIRAVESDRAVVVASTTGYSAIIAPDGRLIQRSGTWRQAILEARVPLLTHITLADRVGAWPEWVIVALTAAAALAGAFGFRKQRG
jgi:apolipoprotein N-acyltransferase